MTTPLTTGAVSLNGVVCPECRGPLAATEAGATCTQCGAAYRTTAGILTLVPASANLDHDHEELYWRDMAPQVERPWRETKGHLARAFQHLFIDGMKPHGRVLEVDGGMGWASSLVKAANPAIEMTATDLSPSGLRLSERVVADIGAAVDRYLACDMERLPFEDGYFDFVFGIAMLHHASHLSAVLAEVRRVLKPGGVFFDMDEFATNRLFRLWWTRAPWSPFADRSEHLGVTEAVYTLGEWRQAVAAAGFSKATVEFNRDPRFKRTDSLRHVYFKLSAALPHSVFALGPGGSVVIRATR